MKKNAWKKLEAKVIASAVSLAMVCTSLPLMPWTEKRAQAAEGERQINIGTAQIDSPSQAGDTWSGDYVYFGSYNNSPIKWRVLDTTGNAGNSSAQGGMLLQSDKALVNKVFENGEDSADEHENGTLPDNQWSVSDIRTWLQGSASGQFLSSNNFSDLEKGEILSTTTSAGSSPVSVLSSVGLNSDTMFLLDVCDLANGSYGYRYSGSQTNIGIGDFWWLRNAHSNSKYSTVAGSVLSEGYVYYNFTSEEGGVVPAFNLNTSNVLFATAANGTKNTSLAPVSAADIHEWKLTLQDSNQSVEVSGEIDRQAESVTVPYTYSGTGANQLSVMIIGEEGSGLVAPDDGEDDDYYDDDEEDDDYYDDDDEEEDDDYYDDDEEEDDDYYYEEDEDIDELSLERKSANKTVAGGALSSQDNIKFYGKVGDIAESGEVEFDLPDDFNEDEDQIYLFAEQVNGANRTDYASELTELEIPPLHKHVWAETWSYDEDAHWHACINNNPPCDIEDPEDYDDYEEHEWDEGVELKEATCYVAGEILYTCEVCGYTMIEETDPEHDFGDEEDWVVIKEPTWDDEGEVRMTCSICGATEEDTIPSLSEQHEDEGHDYEEVGVIVKQPTCTEEGIKRYYCTTEQCPEYIEEEIDALGHTFGKWTTTVAATVDAEGVESRTCSVCGEVETRSIPKIEHTHDYHEGVWVTDEDSHWNQCDCGEKANVGSHTWDSGKVITAPTKKKTGTIRYTCSVCGRTEDRVLAKIGTQFSSGTYQYQLVKSSTKKPVAAVVGFAKGKSAKKVEIAETVTLKKVEYSVKSIAKRAFYQNTKIQEVTIKNNIETIGKHAFFAASNIETITIGTGLKDIGEHTFCHLIKLKTITIKSKNLKTVTGFSSFHGMEDFEIRVPKNKVKQYKKKVFFNNAQNVKAI